MERDRSKSKSKQATKTKQKRNGEDVEVRKAGKKDRRVSGRHRIGRMKKKPEKKAKQTIMEWSGAGM